MSDRLRVVSRESAAGPVILIYRGRKCVAYLTLLEARELGADLVLAAEAATATAPLVGSDPGLLP